MTAAESFDQGVNAGADYNLPLEDKGQMLVDVTVPVLKGFK